MSREEQEEYAVREVGEAIGYGRAMQLCEKLWRALDNHGGEHTVGPCAAELVPCTCAHPAKCDCDWCCGTGRVTRRVREAMEAANG